MQEITGDVFCTKCKMEKCVFNSTNKTSSFYDCKKWKASCHVLNIPFKKQMPTLTVFGVDGTCCFAKRPEATSISLVEEFRLPITIYRNRA